MSAQRLGFDPFLSASPLSLDVRYVFGELQCLPVGDCSAVSCDSGALTRGSERTSFSTILNQSPPVGHFDVLF